MSLDHALLHQRPRYPGMVNENIARFSPLSVANLFAWWNPGVLTGYSDADPVTTLPDSSGNMDDMQQLTASAQPLYYSNILNGHPAIYLDNSNDGMVSSVSLATNFTIFMLYKSSKTSGNGRALQGTSNNWLLGPYSGTHRVYNNSWIVDGAVNSSVWVLCTVTRTAGGTSFRVNRSVIGSNGGTLVPGVLAFGASGRYAEPMYGHIAECFVYNRALTSDEIVQLETYILDKFGV